MDGDHFASRCECVTIHFQDDTIPPVELFVKKTVTNSDYAGLLSDMQMFETEESFFNTIFADMNNYSRERNGFELEGLLPKCYYADKSLVVLENLFKRGYVMLDKLKRHTVEQSSAPVGATLLKDAFLTKYPSLVDAHMWSEAGAAMNGPFLDSIFHTSLKILQTHPTPGSGKALEHILQFETEGFFKLAKYFDLKNPSCARVVCHGDIWGANMMFKQNEETQEYDECVIIDFQTAHLGSPALDLVYYMFLAVDSEARRSNWKKLLQVYYNAFAETVEKLQGEMKFSLKDLMNEFRRNAEPGFFFGLFFVFGVKVFEKIPDVENIEGNVMETIIGTLNDMIEQSITEEGTDFSVAVVEAFQEFQTLVNEQD
ncbi:unnamed protein product [Allacma fusca]|uniref:CHK kinase-like domain-containing protein n=1 Tax=Allacma fusca TaxID=39272 RepID=A0A8J2PI10_9HEXA|nr:unnamed protein product [Allacma fusca]